MSVVALTLAFKARIGKSSTKSVLIAMADRADDKTGLLFPSVADLVERTELDRKTVLGCMMELQDRKILIDTGKRTGRTNQIKIWRLDFSLINQLSHQPESVPKMEQFQKRNSSKFPLKASRFSAESIPKTGHGTTNKPSFNHHHEIDELIEAAIWASRTGGKEIKNESGFRHKIRARILLSGASDEDIKSLSDWRAGQNKKKQQTEAGAGMFHEELKTDPEACARGASLLSSELKARLDGLTLSPAQSAGFVG